MDYRAVAKGLLQEHPQTIAVALSRLEPAQAGGTPRTPMGSGLTFGYLMLNYRHGSQTPHTFSFSRVSRYPSR